MNMLEIGLDKISIFIYAYSLNSGCHIKYPGFTTIKSIGDKKNLHISLLVLVLLMIWGKRLKITENLVLKYIYKYEMWSEYNV